MGDTTFDAKPGGRGRLTKRDKKIFDLLTKGGNGGGVRSQSRGSHKSGQNGNQGKKGKRGNNGQRVWRGTKDEYASGNYDEDCDGTESFAGSAFFGAREGGGPNAKDSKTGAPKMFTGAVQFTITSPTGTPMTKWYMLKHTGPGAPPAWSNDMHTSAFTGKSKVCWAWPEGGPAWVKVRIMGDGNWKALGEPGNPIKQDSEGFQELCKTVFSSHQLTTVVRCHGTRPPTAEDVVKALSSHANRFGAAVTSDGGQGFTVGGVMVDGILADSATMKYTIVIGNGHTVPKQTKPREGEPAKSYTLGYYTITVSPIGGPKVPGVEFQYQ